MFLMVVILLLEAIFCRFVFYPTLTMDLTWVALFLLAVNTVMLLLIVLLRTKREDFPIRNILLIGIILRVVILLFDVYGQHIFTLPNSGSDTAGYHSVARSYAFGARSNLVDFTDYSYLLSLVYRMMGAETITGQFINVFLSIWALILLNECLKKFEIEDNIRFLVMGVSTFLPNLMIISSILLRETLIYFLIMVSFYFFTLWWVDNKKSSLIFVLLFSLAASALHAGAFAVLAGYILIFIFTYGQDRKFSFRGGTVFIALLFLVAFMVFYQAFGDTFFEKFRGVTSAEDIVAHSQILNSDDAANDTGSSSYEIGNTEGGGLGTMIVYSPIRMLYFIFAPLPWQWRGINDIFAFCFSALYYIVVFAFAIYALRKGDKDSKHLIISLLIICLLSVFVMAWGVSSSGSALRHREKFTLLYSVLLALSLNSLYLKGDNKIEKFFKLRGK